MPVDNEIMVNVDLVKDGVMKSLTSRDDNKAETMLSVAAAIEAGFTLLALHLSNVKRQADALEAMYLASQSPAPLPGFPHDASL
jgi:hypothetical protein